MENLEPPKRDHCDEILVNVVETPSSMLSQDPAHRCRNFAVHQRIAASFQVRTSVPEPIESLFQQTRCCSNFQLDCSSHHTARFDQTRECWLVVGLNSQSHVINLLHTHYRVDLLGTTMLCTALVSRCLATQNASVFPFFSWPMNMQSMRIW